MPKARLETKRYVTVPIVGEDGKERARRWLWEFLKRNNLVAERIEHLPDRIVAIVSTEKEFSF